MDLTFLCNDLHYHSSLVTLCSMLESAQIIAKLLLDHWEKFLMQDVLIEFFTHGSVFGQNYKRDHSECFAVIYLERSGFFAALLDSKSSPHCACKCTYTNLLPIPSKLCTGDDMIPSGEDGPGAFWTLWDVLKPLLQPNLSS